jgi:hypothetical protein
VMQIVDKLNVTTAVVDLPTRVQLACGTDRMRERRHASNFYSRRQRKYVDTHRFVAKKRLRSASNRNCLPQNNTIHKPL